MSADRQLARLVNRVAWSASSADIERWRSVHYLEIVGELCLPADIGRPARESTWASVEVDDQAPGATMRSATAAWVRSADSSPRPLEVFMELFWMDWFGLSMRLVKPVSLTGSWLQVLARHGLGNFAELLNAVTVNPAMLRFLDGDTSVADGPNENYARELMELYTVGVGAFDETDVANAARALTGWRVTPNGRARFVPELHDPKPVLVRGQTASDVESLLAVCLEPVTAERIVERLADRILGAGHRGELAPIVDRLATDWQLRPAVQALLEQLGTDVAAPVMAGPVSWLARAHRVCETQGHERQIVGYFDESGQKPLHPPNVNGYELPETWLSTAATIARFNMASHLAERSPRSVHNLGIDEMARHLGLVDGFAEPSRAALALCQGRSRLAVALVTPEVLAI